MKDKLVTLQDIESIDQKIIAKILYEAIQFDDRLYKKVQSRLMKNDTVALQKQLTKRINSISRGRKFIEYRYSLIASKIFCKFLINFTIMFQIFPRNIFSIHPLGISVNCQRH
ncbi:hypothetical protein, partial [Sulfurimonas sp. NWX79]|uniref:hypothetical protein n=1 Tax=Sulfurimonas sp. NWX79 TaxID=2925412 RepID=UPI003204D1AF